jgi:hypothetical protein
MMMALALWRASQDIKKGIKVVRIYCGIDVWPSLHHA